MTGYAQEFADQLKALENDGDVDAFVSAVFSADVALLRPATGQQLDGVDGARAFWTEYLATFETIASTFSRVLDGEVAVLEWSSTGRLADGDDVTYSGVSLLDHDEQGKVRRFTTYYDNTAFVVPPELV